MTVSYPPPEAITVRPALPEDQPDISAFLNFQPHTHRHLDWKSPLDWLGSQPFLVAEYQGSLLGVLACPPDPPHVAWIRLFASSYTLPIEPVWRLLLNRASQGLPGSPGLRLAGLALQPWFARLMQDSGFETRQSIVVLEWNGRLPAPRTVPAEVSVRKMLPADLPEVAEVDAAAFDPLWQNSLDSLTTAYQQASVSTVAETGGRIIGYQISTSFAFGGHLARLAVRPDSRGLNIGYALVHDLLTVFKRQGAWRVTVNTQNDNHVSLNLYQRAGFERTGEEFDVYTLPIG